jgi:hypothetical protein
MHWRPWERLDNYLLTAAVLEISSGDPDRARQRLHAQAPANGLPKIVALLLRAIMAPSSAESIQKSADDAAAAAAGAIDLPLSQQLTIIGTLQTLRIGVAVMGGSTERLEARTAELLAHIREHYPSHRQAASDLAGVNRVLEAAARDKHGRNWFLTR